MDIEQLMIEPLGGKKNHFSSRIGSFHEFYLSGEVGPAENYIEWFDIIRNAGPDDTIKIHINSPGGDLYTAIQFIRVVGECQGTVVTSVEGACMSAATLIFMHADSYEVSPHSVFMFHNYSTGMYGKGGELYDSIMHERKWSERLLNEMYKDFLEEDEIQGILNNKDIWMDGDEVATRIEKRAKLLDEQVAETEPKPTKKTTRPRKKSVTD